MFQTEMAAGQSVRTVPGDEVARTRAELGIREIDSLDPRTLARVRTGLAADFVLRGHYLDLGIARGNQLRVDLELVDTASGDVLLSVPETGTEATLFTMVAHAASAVRQKLGVQDLSPAEGTQLRALIPSSMKAEQLYSQGIEKMRLFDAIGAHQSLKQAADADPSFALTYLALSDACLLLGYEAEASLQAKKAADLSVRLPQELYLWIRGRDRQIARDWLAAIDIYKSLWMVFPDNLEYGLRLVRTLASSGKGNDAFTTIDELRKLPAPLNQDPRIDLAEAATAEAIGDFKRESAAAARAEHSASVRGARLLEAAAQLRNCWALNSLGERKKALALAEHARSTYAAIGDRGGEAQALKNLADLLDDQGDHRSARDSYEAALSLFRKIGYKSGAAITSNNLAYTLKDQGDLVGAKRMFEESLAISRAVADRGRAALPLSGIGSILWREGDLEGATKMYEEALSVYIERNDKTHAATVLGNIGLVLEDQGHLMEAQNKLQQSLTMLREIGDRPGIARTLGNLGELLLKEGDLVHARRRFEEHLTIGRALADEKQIAYALHELGEFCVYSGDLNEARTRLQEDLDRRTKMGETGTAAETRLILAEVLLEKEQFGNAESTARMAVEELRKEGEGDSEAAGEAILARCLSAQGKTTDAQQFAARALKAASKSQDVGVRIELLINGSRATATANIVDATHNLNAALRDAKKYGYHGRQLEARFGLAEIASKTGNTAANRELATIEKEAKTRGFGLIARKAAAARNR